MSELWAVYGSDGVECNWLCGVFETEEQAVAAAAAIEANEIENAALLFGDEEDPKWHGSVSVSKLVVGEYELPHNLEYLRSDAWKAELARYAERRKGLRNA